MNWPNLEDFLKPKRPAFYAVIYGSAQRDWGSKLQGFSNHSINIYWAPAVSQTCRMP